MRVRHSGSRMSGLVLIVLALVVPVLAAAQGAPRSAINGRWAGFWVSYSSESQGFLYEATMTLAVGANNAVDGRIDWVLRKSPRAAEQAKVGMTAVEFVRGSYDPRGGVIRLAGYRKDDPNNVIGLDRYHLVVSDNGRVIGGITESQGSWQGSLSTLKRP